MKTKRELLREIEIIERLEEQMQNIMQDSILIGSRLWDVQTEGSDFDYLIDNYYQLDEVLRVCKDLELQFEILQGSSSSEEHRMYNTDNLKVKFRDQMLNFIAYDRGDLLVIKNQVLPRMNEIPRKLLIDKRVRVMMFNGLLDIFLGEKYEFVNKKEKFVPLPIINIDEDDLLF